MPKYMGTYVAFLSACIAALLNETTPYALETPHILLNQLLIALMFNTVGDSLVNLNDREAIIIYRGTMLSYVATNVACYSFGRLTSEFPPLKNKVKCSILVGMINLH